MVLKTIALEKDSIVNCDETWCKVRKYDHYKKCYIWVLVNKAEKIAISFYEDGSRGRDVLTHFLGDAELKSIMTDGYNAYVFIGDELKSTKFKDTEHQICMAHAMAKLAKAETERTIRKLTTQRNNSLHYGSDEGVEMAVAYHSVISTVKLHGMSCWRYLGEFFKKIFNGCRDFFSLTPANIGMAYAKYRANKYKASLLDLYRVQPIFIN